MRAIESEELVDAIRCASAPLVACIGNPARGDDCFGYLVYSELMRLGCINRVRFYGIAAQNVLGDVEELGCDVVVFVNASYRGDVGHGELGFYEYEGDEASNDMSTHTLSLAAVAALLKLMYGCRCFLLCCGAVSAEGAASLVVREAAKRAAALLAKCLEPYRC